MPRRKCWLDACSRESDRLGMCESHASRWDEIVRVAPRTKLRNKTDRERYEFYTNKTPSKVIQEEFGARPDCWVWMGSLNHHGYGLFNSDLSKSLGIGQQVHLFVLNEYAGVDTRNDLHTDHKCRFRPCSNPDHLVRVTRRENILLGVGAPARNARKEYCGKGHEFTPKNTTVNSKGWRTCKECNRQANREYTSRPEVKEARREKYAPSSGVHGKGQYQTERDTCAEGHKLEGDNLVLEKRTRNGKVTYVRRCRACVNARSKRAHAARKGSPEEKGWITTRQAAELMGIKPSYFPSFTKRRPGFPEPVRRGRPDRYLKDDIEAWIAANREVLERASD